MDSDVRVLLAMRVHRFHMNFVLHSRQERGWLILAATCRPPSAHTTADLLRRRRPPGCWCPSRIRGRPRCRSPKHSCVHKTALSVLTSALSVHHLLPEYIHHRHHQPREHTHTRQTLFHHRLERPAPLCWGQFECFVFEKLVQQLLLLLLDSAGVGVGGWRHPEQATKAKRGRQRLQDLRVRCQEGRVPVRQLPDLADYAGSRQLPDLADYAKWFFFLFSPICPMIMNPRRTHAPPQARSLIKSFLFRTISPRRNWSFTPPQVRSLLSPSSGTFSLSAARPGGSGHLPLPRSVLCSLPPQVRSLFRQLAQEDLVICPSPGPFSAQDFRHLAQEDLVIYPSPGPFSAQDFFFGTSPRRIWSFFTPPQVRSLRKIFLFRHLAQEELVLLAQHAQKKTLYKCEEITRQGEAVPPGEEALFYVVRSGTIGVFQEGKKVGVVRRSGTIGVFQEGTAGRSGCSRRGRR